MSKIKSEPVTSNPVVTFYFDVRSPFSYLARDEVLALPETFAVSVEALPYTVALEEAFGAPQTRSPRELRKIKYTYMDVRRFANERGLIVRGTIKVFDPRIAHAAYLYARRSGRDRALYDRLLPPFWNREFDIEDVERIVALLSEIGAAAEGFRDYLAREADRELSAIAREADEAGVFGVPTCVFQGELFWGADRVDVLKRRLAAAGLVRSGDRSVG
jgi:2-hydroxychromene-2-carboxylate isomerase